jgi:hypothetical protein
MLRAGLLLVGAGAGDPVTLGGVALLVDVHAATKLAATRWRIRDPTPEDRGLFPPCKVSIGAAHHDVTHTAIRSRRNRSCPPDLVVAICRRRHHRDVTASQAVGKVVVEVSCGALLTEL